VDPIATDLLTRLLRSGENHEAGARRRAPVLTAAALRAYRDLNQLNRKEAVEAAFKVASAQQILDLDWDGPERDGGFICRVTLRDPTGLARLLGREPAIEQRARARDTLAPYLDAFPVLHEVLTRWSEMKTVRGFGPENAAVWRDAAMAIEWSRRDPDSAGAYRPVRVVSAAAFQDSKRIEAITPAIDVLLMQSLVSQPREAHEVWSELGVAKEEQPARLAGHVHVIRDRVTALLDAPYAAFPIAAVLGVDMTRDIHEILSIENLTTFHQEARRRCDEPVLLIFTGGAPSPAWRAMYTRILKSIPAAVPVRHWGDVDEGGFRIAAQISKVTAALGRRLEPYRMHPREVPQEKRRTADPRTLEQMRRFAKEAGWHSIAEEIDTEHGFTVEQEALDE
jgi:hypothetical protein